MRCLVTGAAGFVGGSIARGLHALGYEVLGVDRADQVATPFPTATLDLALDAADSLFASFEPEVVVHAAGPASVASSLSDPGGDFKGATYPWIGVLDAARKMPIPRPRMILISSAAAYGEPEQLPITEHTQDHPISPYGYHRHVCEALAQSYSRNFELEICSLRLFSTYGPSQRRLLVWELMTQALGNAPSISLLGTGDEVRDYVFEADLPLIVDSVLKDVSRPTKINVASGHATTTRELAHQIARVCRSDKPITFQGKLRKGDPQSWRVDNALLLRMLSPRSLTSMDAGLAACAKEWMRTNGQRE